MSLQVPDDVFRLIENSGNAFHARVARWFADNGWHVVISPYYMDQTQNKAREIDLIVEKLWPITDHSGRAVDYVAIRLFVECKFVASHSVFWFSNKDEHSAEELVCSDGFFRSDNIYTKKHHYLANSQKVAKLFATSSNKLAENEPFYKALNQALNAMVAMRGQPVSIPSTQRIQRSPRLVLEFPVVICNSFEQLFSVDFFADPQPERITDNFQLEVRYAYIDRHNNQRDDYFLLDFVEFDQLDKFCEAVNETAKAAAHFASD